MPRPNLVTGEFEGLTISSNLIPRDTYTGVQGDVCFKFKGESYRVEDFRRAHPDKKERSGWDGILELTSDPSTGLVVYLCDPAATKVIVGTYTS